MPFQNLPGIVVTKLDGNLQIPSTNDTPIILVLGTSAQGDSEELFTVARASDASRTFGKEGTLVRGMYEAVSAGASNIRLFRIGAKPARLVDVGGLTVETVAKDGSAGGDYAIFFTASTGRIKVYRVSDDVLVFDSGDSNDPSTVVDLGEVSVSGTASGGVDIGSASVPVALSGVAAVDPTVTFTPGDDGLELSRMETYEALDAAYSLLQDSIVDIVVPMNVYLDDLNVTDMTKAAASGLLTALTDYPVAGTATDVLGKLYKEEYQSKTYYFWDVDHDGVAEIVPTVEGFTANMQTRLDAGNISIAAVAEAGDSGASSADSDLIAADFHEVNFAYQLANHCYNVSHLNHDMFGVIGVKAPRTFGLKDVSDWVGSSPAYAVDSSGNLTISENGTGLLGNKFMAGRKDEGSGSTLKPGLAIDGVFEPYGGFIATDDGEVDGVHLTDGNDHLVDIGKHLEVVSAYPLLVNPSRSASYAASGAATYAGLIATLAPASAPTNKVVPNVSLPFTINQSKVDKLAGARYVHFFSKPKGIVVADAPTAARPDSDYTRLTTVRIVKAVVDTVRLVGEPFLGEGMSGSQLAALETGISNSLQELVKAGILQRFDLSVDATNAERIQGKVRVNLILVPVFELRTIDVTVALAAA